MASPSKPAIPATSGPASLKAQAQNQRRPRPQVVEYEILRISALLGGDEPVKSADLARSAVLSWVKGRTAGVLPPDAALYRSFEHHVGARFCSAVRLNEAGIDVWIVRADDPDKNVAGRIWTTEVAVVLEGTASARFSLRLIASSTETLADVEPAVPGVVLQLVKSPGLKFGNFRLVDKPITVRTEHDSEVLMDALVAPERKLPVVALSVPEGAIDPERPLLDAATLARTCAGLALVVVLPASASWRLTERFGKKLSVYGGAARVYLPGFTEDSNPFGGHELLLPQSFSNDERDATIAVAHLRWIAAKGSVRRLQLGTDVMSFAPLRMRELERRQRDLKVAGATDKEQLEAAQQKIKLMEKQLIEATRDAEDWSRLAVDAEDRAEAAETRAKSSGFRIQQLEAQIAAQGRSPDEAVVLPSQWSQFAEWCDDNFAGRIVLTSQARRSLKDSVFEDVELAARCVLWLGNAFRSLKMEGAKGTLRDLVLEPSIINAHCGNDSFPIEWQGKRRDVEWHIKNGGNTRDPKRCLRIYYFWDDASLQTVIASMPAHRHTDAS